MNNVRDATSISRLLALLVAPTLTLACTAADMCAAASDYVGSAVAGHLCCNNAFCTSYNFDDLDESCTACTGTPLTTEALCTGAGNFWYSMTCSEALPGYAGYCSYLTTNMQRIGTSCCGDGAPATASSCTAADVCTPESDYDGGATGEFVCCEDAMCTSYNYALTDTTCEGCNGNPPLSTEEACDGAGKYWYAATCDEQLSQFEGFCGALASAEITLVQNGFSCCGSASPLPSPPAPSPLPPPPDEEGGSSVGMIAGIIGGAFGLLCLTTASVMYIKNKNKQNKVGV